MDYYDCEPPMGRVTKCNQCHELVSESEITEINGLSICADCLSDYCENHWDDYSAGYIGKNKDDFALMLMNEMPLDVLYSLVLSHYDNEKTTAKRVGIPSTVEWCASMEERFCMAHPTDFEDFIKQEVS